MTSPVVFASCALFLVLSAPCFAAAPQILDLFTNPDNAPVPLTSHKPDAGTVWMPVVIAGMADPVPQVAANRAGYVQGDPTRVRSSASMTLTRPFAAPITGESTLVWPSSMYQSAEMTHRLILTDLQDLNGLMLQWTIQPYGAPVYDISVYELVQNTSPRLIANANITTWFPPDSKIDVSWVWYPNGTCTTTMTVHDAHTQCRGTTTVHSPSDLYIDTTIVQFESDNPPESIQLYSLQIN